MLLHLLICKKLDLSTDIAMLLLVKKVLEEEYVPSFIDIHI